jgi:small subunit ribosomal protein S16
MLVIRLSRTGRNKRPFFRVVLTEHSKPVKAWYKEVLGRYDPIKHTGNFDIDSIKKYISLGATPSDRVGKILFSHTKDKLFEKFFVVKTLNRKPKKEDK